MSTWKDLRSKGGRWLGLELAVGKRPTPPAWHLQFASPSLLRLTCQGAPLLWARIDTVYWGFRWLRAATAYRGPIAPLRAHQVRAIRAAPGSDDWYAAWGRFFARGLATSSCSPLHEGTWHLLHDNVLDGVRDGPVDLLDGKARQIISNSQEYPHQLIAGEAPYDERYVHQLFGLTQPSTLSPSRLKVWRKRAREGTLPPVLVLQVQPLLCFLILDGHHRWMAALMERVSLPVLTLVNMKVWHFPPNLEDQPRIERLYLERASGTFKRKPIGLEDLNVGAISAWGGWRALRPASRVWPIPGRASQWLSEVRARLEALGGAVEPGLRARLLERTR